MDMNIIMYLFIYFIFYKYEQNWIDILAFAG